MGRAETIIGRFPSFYQSKDVENVFHQFIEVFGAILDEAESDLIKVMRAHWVDTADNENSRGFDTAQKGDLDKIFSLYLENLGGTSQLKQGERRSGDEGLIDDEIYRERIKGLINVLKSGASTKEGIITIVAANLGIVGDEPTAVAARETIRILEFLPEPITTEVHPLALFEEFVVENPNVVDTTPEIRIRPRDDFFAPLVNPRIVNLSTGGFAQYTGTVTSDDVLSFFPDGTALLNGVAIPLDGSTPFLPPGESRWRFEALAGVAEAHFDASPYDFSLFDLARVNRVGVFNQEGSHFNEAIFAAENAAIDLHMILSKLQPASFMVRIPWDIPGYTEKFDDLAVNPRNQIKYIVDKVKAGGGSAVIAYEKQFTETQGMDDTLTIQLPLGETHTAEEANFDMRGTQVPYPDGVEHEMSDNFVTSGVFDFTRFDSLNTFA